VSASLIDCLPPHLTDWFQIASRGTHPGPLEKVGKDEERDCDDPGGDAGASAKGGRGDRGIKVIFSVYDSFVTECFKNYTSLLLNLIKVLVDSR
jgi:hypothetical protein